MRIATRVAGVAGAAALGVMTLGSTAFADTSDNDGINVLDDNNVSAVPVQACGNNVGVGALVIPLLSPQSAECVNAPIVDHPSNEG